MCTRRRFALHCRQRVSPSFFPCYLCDAQSKVAALFGRLTQEYVLDMHACSVHERLAYLINSPDDNIRMAEVRRDSRWPAACTLSPLPQACAAPIDVQNRRVVQAVANQERAAERARDDHERQRIRGAALPRLLPASVPGSRKHQQRLVDDGMAVITTMGKPTFWLTMTANPEWPEIQRGLREAAARENRDGPVQHASERPDIVVRRPLCVSTRHAPLCHTSTASSCSSL
jgi:hypothetical protein